MADLLTHVLVADIVATLLSWRYTWLSPPYVTVAMVGPMIPEFSRLDLLISDELITGVLEMR